MKNLIALGLALGIQLWSLAGFGGTLHCSPKEGIIQGGLGAAVEGTNISIICRDPEAHEFYYLIFSGAGGGLGLMIKKNLDLTCPFVSDYVGSYFGFEAAAGINDFSFSPNVFVGPRGPCYFSSPDSRGAIAAAYVAGFEIDRKDRSEGY